MAHITQCSYCGGNVCDKNWHLECRIAHLEGLLHNLRKLVSVGADADIQRVFGRLTEMTCILHQENWHSKEEFEAERAAEAARQLEEALRAGAKANWLVTKASEWDLLNPKTSQPVNILGVGEGGEPLTLRA